MPAIDPGGSRAHRGSLVRQQPFISKEPTTGRRRITVVEGGKLGFKTVGSTAKPDGPFDRRQWRLEKVKSGILVPRNGQLRGKWDADPDDGPGKPIGLTREGKWVFFDLEQKTWLDCEKPSAFVETPGDPVEVPEEPAAVDAGTGRSVTATDDAPAVKRGAFRIDAGQLQEDLVRGIPRFSRHHAFAKKLEHKARFKEHYKAVDVAYRNASGNIDKEVRLVRAEKTPAQRVKAFAEKRGRGVKDGYNKLSTWVRSKAGRPRKTGSDYGSGKGSGPLLSMTTLNPVGQLGAGASFAKMGVSAIGGGMVDHGLTAPLALAGIGGGLLGLGLPSSIADMMDAGDGVVGVLSAEADAKANVLNTMEDARRFLLKQARLEHSSQPDSSAGTIGATGRA